MVSHYGNIRDRFMKAIKLDSKAKVETSIVKDLSKISWTLNLKNDLRRGVRHLFNEEAICNGIYRPFCKQKIYFDKPFIERPGITPNFLLGDPGSDRQICLAGSSSNRGFSTAMTNTLTSLDAVGSTQCFPLSYYQEREKDNPTLFDGADNKEFIRVDAISEFILGTARSRYGNKVGKEDIFYYVYGILHSSEYRERFENDLKKMLPRLPLVDAMTDFWTFSRAGRRLAELHVYYEEVPPLPEGVIVTGADTGNYHVEKMRFPAKGQKGTIIYNSSITVSNIPAKAYEYVINGKSAIEWIMEHYQIAIHKESGIRNDPNDWAVEVGNPRYILDLLLSIIAVSTQTVDIVAGLPKLSFE